MIHIRSASHQDSEATVIKANRKHQIVLNMEVKRIEMEKKMRERYFFFEMSLINARRLKIIDRQKSLGIYRPNTREHGRDPRKERRMDSIFFTQSVPLDSKVKLPPVDKRRAVPRYPVKLTNTENYFKATRLSKNINHMKLLDIKKPRHSEDGSGHMITESFDLKERESNSKGAKQKSYKNKEIHGSIEAFNEDLSTSKDQSKGKNSKEENDGRSKCLEAKGNNQRNEERDANRKQSALHAPEEKNVTPEENNVTPEDNSVTLLQNAKDIANIQTLSETTDKIQTKLSSLSIHNKIEFPSYQELRAWRDNFETTRFNFVQGTEVFGRLKSASVAETGKRIKVKQARAPEVRPQSALARLSHE